MKHTLIYTLILALALLFGPLGCEEEGAEDGENGEADEVEVTPESFETEIGEWVTYQIEELGEMTLALVSEEEHEGVPGYWVEVVAPVEEGQNVIIKVLVEKESYKEFGDEVMAWLANPELPEEGFMAEMMAMEGMDTETAVEDIEAGLDEFTSIILRLIIEAEGEAFEIDLPSFTKLIKDQAVAGMEMAEAMEEAYGEEMEEPEEIEMPTFELVKGVKTEAGGKTYSCNKIVITHEGESAEVFFTTEVPFIGLVKVVAEGEEKMSVLDYGHSGYESQLTVAEPMVIDANALMMMFMAPMMMEGGMGGMPDISGMEGMDPEMLEALEELQRMGS